MAERNKKRLLGPIEGDNLFKMNQFQLDISLPQPPLQYPKILYYPLDPQRHIYPKILSIQLNENHNLKVPCDLNTSQTQLNMRSYLFNKKKEANLDEKDQMLIDEEIEIEESEEEQEEIQQKKQIQQRRKESLRAEAEKLKKKEKQSFKDMGFGAFKNMVEEQFTSSELVQQFSDQMEHPTKKNVYSKRICPIQPLEFANNELITNLINTKEVYLALKQDSQKEVYLKQKNLDTEQDQLLNYREISQQQVEKDINIRQYPLKAKKLKKCKDFQDLFSSEHLEKTEEEQQLDTISEASQESKPDEEYEILNEDTDKNLLKLSEKSAVVENNYMFKNNQNYDFRVITGKNDVMLTYDEQKQCYNYIFVDQAFYLEREFNEKPTNNMDTHSLVLKEKYLNISTYNSEDKIISMSKNDLGGQNKKMGSKQALQQKKKKKLQKSGFQQGEEEDDDDFQSIKGESESDIEDLEAQADGVDNIFEDQEEMENDEESDEEEGQNLDDLLAKKKRKQKHKIYSDEDEEDEDEDISREQDELSDRQRKKQLKKMEKSPEKEVEQDLYLQGNDEDDEEEEQFTIGTMKPKKTEPKPEPEPVAEKQPEQEQQQQEEEKEKPQQQVQSQPQPQSQPKPPKSDDEEDEDEENSQSF